MKESDVARAVDAALATATAIGLAVDEAAVLHNSNKLAVRLLPGDVLARIAPAGQEVAGLEIAVARRLAEIGSPMAALDPRADPRPHERDGFVITFWTFYPQLTSPDLAAGAYAVALKRLHAGMLGLDVRAPSFLDRVAEAEHIVARKDISPNLPAGDRALLAARLSSLRRAVLAHGAPEQLLHGEPHPGNVLNTPIGPVFIDLETCCRGPVEFDLAHAPEPVGEHYAGLDRSLLDACRGLVLAMVAAWRWDAGDQFPDGRLWTDRLMDALREGAPWPSLDALGRRFAR